MKRIKVTKSLKRDKFELRFDRVHSCNLISLKILQSVRTFLLILRTSLMWGSKVLIVASDILHLQFICLDSRKKGYSQNLYLFSCFLTRRTTTRSNFPPDMGKLCEDFKNASRDFSVPTNTQRLGSGARNCSLVGCSNTMHVKFADTLDNLKVIEWLEVPHLRPIVSIWNFFLENLFYHMISLTPL